MRRAGGRSRLVPTERGGVGFISNYAIMELDPEVYCLICENSLMHGKVETVREKGLQTIIASSKERGDNKVNLICEMNSVRLHANCRKSYTSKKNLQNMAKKKQKQSPVNENTVLSLENCCFFCEENITEDFLKNEAKKPYLKRRLVFDVKEVHTKDSIIRVAQQKNDVLSRKVST